MLITVKIHPGSSHEKIEQVNNTHYAVWVKAPATEGKANKALVVLLSKHFNVAPSLIEIESGNTSKNKVISIRM